MVSKTLITRDQISNFEKQIFERILKEQLINDIKQEANKRDLIVKIYVFHENTSITKYLSHLIIEIYDKNNMAVAEQDEPNCCLMACEPLCFMHHKRIVGVDLCDDREYVNELEELLKKIKQYFFLQLS